MDLNKKLKAKSVGEQLSEILSEFVSPTCTLSAVHSYYLKKRIKSTVSTYKDEASGSNRKKFQN